MQAGVDLLRRLVRLEPDTTKNDEALIPAVDERAYEVLTMQPSIRDAQHLEKMGLVESEWRSGPPLHRRTRADTMV